MPTLQDAAQFPYGLAVGPNGPVLSPGTTIDPYYGSFRPGGIEIPHRRLITSSQTIGSQGMRVTYFTAPYSMLSRGAEFGTGTTAAGATPSLIRYGLYSVDASSQGLTLIASTTSDLTLLAAINTRYPKNWDTPAQLVAGQRYAVSILVVTAAAVPNFPSTTALVGVLHTLLPITGATVAGQADLPATVTSAAAAVAGTDIYVFVY